MSEETITKPDSHIAKSGIFEGANPGMAIASMIMIIVFVVFTIWDVDASNEIFAAGKKVAIGAMGWFYVLVVNVTLFFTFWLLFCRFGDVKLGHDDEEPDFSTFSWICMLFSAGLGSGLIYWGIAEPMYHIQGNPFMEMNGTEPLTTAAGASANLVTNFHWGLHGWGVFVVVGLALAYFSYRKDLPLSMRTTLYPILGDKIYGFWGHLVDLLCVFGTIFGLATSLGLGVKPISAGLANLGFMEDTQTNQLILVGVITLLGTTSAATGVGKGVRILSECNIWASIFLLLLFFILGPTTFMLAMVLTGFGDYIWNVIPMGFWMNTNPENTWQSGWTIFYWGWWISWCPFVGLFIARVSKGRTIREFSIAVLLIPTSVVVLWMSAFGGAATFTELFGVGGVVDAVNNNYADGVFTTLAGFGYDSLLYPITVLTTILLISWFVTSSDSGTLVMATMMSMGSEHPPVKFRIFWGLTSGIVAGVLMLAGGLGPLQTASIVAGLPIAGMLILMCYGIAKSLHEDFPIPEVEDKREMEFLKR